MAARKRQERARNKLAMDRGDFMAPLKARIREVYATDWAVHNTTIHASLEANPLQRMADAVAGAPYLVPPVRRLRSNRATEMLGEVANRAHLDASMRRAVRVAFLTGVAWLRPHPAIRAASPFAPAESLVPEIEVIDPSTAIRAWYGSDKCHPDVLLCSFRSKDPGLELARFVVHDATGVHYLDAGGKVLDVRETGMDMPPLAEIRVDEPDPCDPWDAMRNDRLYTATLDVARLIAHQRWIRKEQSRKHLVIRGQGANDMPEGQARGPDAPIISTDDPDSLQVDVLDFDLAITNSEAEITALLERVAEGYGLSARVLGINANGSPGDSMRAEEHSALAALRDRQVLHVAEGDKAACTRLARAAAVCGIKCPPPERVWGELEINYAPLTFVDHPLQRLAVAAEEIKLGLADHVTIYQRFHPYLTRRDAEARLRESVDIRNEINALLSAHQTPKDPRQDGEQLSARQGRVGGQASPDGDAEASEDNE